MPPQHKVLKGKQPNAGKTPETSGSDGGKWKRYIVRPANQVALATFILLVITIGIYIYQAYLTRDQEHRQLRAYVGPFIGGQTKSPDFVCPDCAMPKSVGDVASRDSLSVNFKNFGSTPAYGPENCVFPLAVAVNGKVTPQLASDKMKTCTLISRRTIWPGEERVYRFAFNESTVEMIRSVRTKQFAPYSPFDIYITGFVAYHDVFGEPHKTYICFKYEFINGQDWFEDTGDVVAADY